MTRSRPAISTPATSATPAARPSPRWLLLVHQLPSSSSNLRVRTWRRLQQIGAIPVGQAVYVLPDLATTREDFEWLRTEIADAGGDARVFAAGSVDRFSDDALREAFRRSRQDDYAELARDVTAVLAQVGRSKRRAGSRAPSVVRRLEAFQQRLAAIERADFFGAAGRDRVLMQLAQLEAVSGRPRAEAGSGTETVERVRDRLWVTRPRPGVDRMASAWLIRRFIDPAARFGFVPDRAAAPADAIAFDMFGAELTHRADHCTFETLCETFRLNDAALTRVAAVVHDLDLKDGRFSPADGPTIARLIDGLQLANDDDEKLLADGMRLFEALYRAFAQAERPPRPRPAAGTKSRPRSRRKIRAQ
jgi:hypothetical protein